MGLCQRLRSWTTGSPSPAGEPAEVRRHPEVIRAYLGK